MDSGPLPILIAILGPTASGKSDLAIHLASRCRGEIINCDSLQVYRGFDIGTAKIPPADRNKVPHHLLDVADPTKVYTAGDFVRDTRELLPQLAQRGAVPVIAGGTGFYLRALLEGLAPAPARDESLRAALAGRESRRAGLLWRYLRRLDSISAGRIHPNDIPKTLRAVEISRLSRQSASDVFAQGRTRLTGYRILKLGLNPPRQELYDRVNQRSARMFDSGLLAEVESLIASGIPRTAKPFGSLGYKEALAVLDGILPITDAIAQTALQTRQYVKRQLTWFRRESEVHWLPGFGHEPSVQSVALDLIRRIN